MCVSVHVGEGWIVCERWLSHKVTQDTLSGIVFLYHLCFAALYFAFYSCIFLSIYFPPTRVNLGKTAQLLNFQLSGSIRQRGPLPDFPLNTVALRTTHRARGYGLWSTWLVNSS